LIDISLLFYFITASVVLTLLPGPDIIFVTIQSISNGKLAGIATALGLCTGLIVHTTAAALGISAVLYNSALAFTLIKYLGAVYLLYLAVRALFEKDNFEVEIVRENFSKLYKRGIFMNLLNPKVSLFFLAFLPQFVDPIYGNVPLQMITLGTVFMVQAIVVFTVVSIFSSILGSKILENKKFQKYINLVKAGIFGSIGLKLALFEK